MENTHFPLFRLHIVSAWHSQAGSLKGARQREIIKVFYKVAKKEGYENTSIAKIAKMMDINPSLIIYYFETKEDLTYGLIDYILERYLLSDSALMTFMLNNK